MKKGLKYGLWGCGSVLILAMVAIIVLVMNLLGGDSQGVPAKVDYHNANDLYRISNIPFPEVNLVDSTFYESFSLQEVTEKFILKNRLEKDALIKNIENKLPFDSMCWKKTDSNYIYYILPEKPIDRPGGSGWRKTQDGELDWDGEFIRLVVPIYNDTIILQYGWER